MKDMIFFGSINHSLSLFLQGGPHGALKPLPLPYLSEGATQSNLQSKTSLGLMWAVRALYLFLFFHHSIV